MRHNQRAVGVMAKHWQPGAVKTRLAATVGPARAAHLQYLCLRTLVFRLSGLESDRILCYTPREAEEAFRNLVAELSTAIKDGRLRSTIVRETDGAGPEQEVSACGWLLRPQGAGDLGQRMRGWFVDCLSSGYAQAVLLGADAPTVPLSTVERAWDQLRHTPVVLAPSADGGYYLVGAAPDAPADWWQIFSDIPWGSHEVYEQTRRRLHARGVPFAELESWYDVDEWRDLPRLKRDLQGSAEEQALRDFVSQLLNDRARF